MPLRIALVFHHRLDLELLESLLRTDLALEVVPIARKAGLLDSADREYDVLFVDAQLPSPCPIGLAQELLARERIKGALVLDRDFSASRAYRCLQSEHLGYLTRDCSAQTLLDGLRRVVAGRLVLDRQAGVEDLTSRRAAQENLRRVDRHGVLRLSERELQVMRLLAQGLTLNDSAQALGLSASTVDNHRTRLKAKLKVQRAVDIAKIALREGIIAEPS